jgi:hypothetical protein
MSNSTQPATGDGIRAQLECLARLDWDMPSFAQALQALLAAVDYHDVTLIRSHLNTALEALRDLVNDAIAKRCASLELLRDTWQKTWEMLKARPSENCDDMRRVVEGRLTAILENFTGLRDGPVRLLQERGYDVARAAQLDRCIQELEGLRHGIFENWPWSDEELPPVDRDMVAASRAAIARGERGERIEDLIRRLGANPTQGE